MGVTVSDARSGISASEIRVASGLTAIGTTRASAVLVGDTAHGYTTGVVYFGTSQSNLPGRHFSTQLTSRQSLANAYPNVTLIDRERTNANPPVVLYDTNAALQARPLGGSGNMSLELSLGQGLDAIVHGWVISKDGIGATGLNTHWKKTATYPAAYPNNLEFEIKKLAGDADPALLHKAVGTGITVLTQSGATLGQFTLTLLPTDLLAIVAGQYTYDLVIQYADGTRTYIIRPTMVIIFDVVNPQ